MNKQQNANKLFSKMKFKRLAKVEYDIIMLDDNSKVDFECYGYSFGSKMIWNICIEGQSIRLRLLSEELFEAISYIHHPITDYESVENEIIEQQIAENYLMAKLFRKIADYEQGFETNSQTTLNKIDEYHNQKKGAQYFEFEEY